MYNIRFDLSTISFNVSEVLVYVTESKLLRIPYQVIFLFMLNIFFVQVRATIKTIFSLWAYFFFLSCFFSVYAVFVKYGCFMSAFEFVLGELQFI